MKPLASVQYVNVKTGTLTLEGMQLFGPIAAQSDGALTSAAIGVTIQPYDATLSALAGLDGDADQVPYFAGPNIMALAGFTDAGRDMVGALDTAAQTALLDLFGDALQGLVPASGGGTINFLRADGTWAVPYADPWSYVELATASTVSTTAYADVAGMSFAAAANTEYEVEIFGAFQAAATTTGIGVAFDVPAGAAIHGLCIAPSAATTGMVSQQIAGGAAVAPTTDVAAANTDYPLWGKYWIRTAGTAGTVQMRQRSEVAASDTIIAAGTRLKWRVLA